MSRDKKLWLFLAGAIALSFLLYGNSLNGGFIYDDNFFADRSELKSSAHLLKIWTEPYLPQNPTAGLYRPLAVFSFALNFILFGESPVSFHLVNIILNGIVIFLVFLLVLKIFGDHMLAFIAALFFTFLPIHTESVAFIKSRDEILAALFAIWSWLLFVSAIENRNRLRWKKITGSALLFLLAVLSKELIIIVPVLFLAIFWIKQKPKFLVFLKAASGFLITGAFYLWLRFQVLGSYAFGGDKSYFAINPLGHVDFQTRIWTAFKIAFVYIGKTLLPINLSATYHYNHLTLVNYFFNSWQAVAGFIILTGLIFLFFYKKTRLTPLGIGALSFFIPYLVISKFIFKSGDILAERWMYFPSVGLSIMAAYFILLIYKRRRKLAIVIFGVVMVTYAAIIIPRNKIWLSDENLFRSMIKTAPNSIQGHSNLANWYMRNDKTAEAKSEAEIGFAIDKEYPPLLNTIGGIAFKDGNYDLAETAFLKAIELAPHIPTGYINAGRLYYLTGQYEKTKKMFDSALGAYARPKTEDVLIYAFALAKLKQYQASIDAVNKYFAGDFNDSQVKLVLAVDYFNIGNMSEARKYFDWDSGKSEVEKIQFLRNF
ncbi:MAG: glycosyltransferase family 39 protein [Candidatus Yanofskybacteria bacterium]|nr:glycosyltransferase family 39 protein [Candidatus Yanofskybacteria bacterium]